MSQKGVLTAKTTKTATGNGANKPSTDLPSSMDDDDNLPSNPFDTTYTWSGLGSGNHNKSAKAFYKWFKIVTEEVTSLKNKVELLEKAVETLEEDNNNKARKIIDLEMDLLNQKKTVHEHSTSLKSLSNGEILGQPNIDDAILNKVKEAAKNVTLAEIVKSGLDKKNDSFEARLAKANMKERREIVKRERNFMIFGLKVDENTNDGEQVAELCESHLRVRRSDIKLVTRLSVNSKRSGSGVDANEKPPPIRVEMHSSEARDNLLKSTSNLKGLERYKRVSILPDLTPSERLALKLEKEECDKLNKKLLPNCPFVWRVRSGIKTKIDVMTNRIYKPTKDNVESETPNDNMGGGVN